jgi:hypothetical protein
MMILGLFLFGVGILVFGILAGMAFWPPVNPFEGWDR